jgi:hypothetical protein
VRTGLDDEVRQTAVLLLFGTVALVLPLGVSLVVLRVLGGALG